MMRDGQSSVRGPSSPRAEEVHELDEPGNEQQGEQWQAARCFLFGQRLVLDDNVVLVARSVSLTDSVLSGLQGRLMVDLPVPWARSGPSAVGRSSRGPT